jgi:hypothetical protein
MRRLLLLTAGLLVLVAASGCGSPAGATNCQGVDRNERLVSPLAESDGISVLVFVSCDCPISNRYLPTLRGLQEQYAAERVRFWLVYPDADVSAEQIERHLRAYVPRIESLRDPRQELVRAAGVTTVPEAAVFVRENGTPVLKYHGAIDNRFVDFGVARVRPTEFHLRDVLDALLAGSSSDFPSAPAIGCPIPRLR